jgi:hypothetical protein
MDVYRALSADVPQILFTVLHQAGPTISDDEFTRTVSAVHMDINKQMQEMSEQLHLWLTRQYSQQAEETLQNLQRLGFLSQEIDKGEVRQILEKNFSRLGGRVGSESMLGLEGSVEVILCETIINDPVLAKRIADGRKYVASLGFKPGLGPVHETWLFFHGSIHYDVVEHIVRDRIGISKGSYGAHIENVGHASFGTYNLVYQLGESLTAHLDTDDMTQEVTFAFNKGQIRYSDFRRDVSALMEYVAEQIDVIHASFWQRKLGLGMGNEFVLHLRLPLGEEPVQEVIHVIDTAGGVGKETIIERGKLMLGKRVL